MKVGEVIKNTITAILGEADEEKQAREIEELANNLRKQRLNWEKRWLLADRFAAGNHFESWRPATNEIGKVVFAKGMNVRPVHYAVRTTEGTMNNLISADPRWKIFPHGIVMIRDEEERKNKIEYARKIGVYFDSLWDDENMRGKAMEMIWNGLKYCFGVLEGYWENGKPQIRSIEPYDILFDPTIKNIRNSSVVIKEVSVSIDEVRANEKYNENKNKLKSDDKASGSDFKESRLAERHGSSVGKGKVLIREAWLRNPNGGWDVKHICQGKLIYVNHYNWGNHPFVSWKLNPEPLLQTSWFERLIPLNRGIDIVLAQIEMWVRNVAVGRMMRQKGAGVERIMGEHGEIIDVEKLDSIQWLQNPEIGATPFNYLAELKSLIAEIGAATASIGRVPRGTRAGFKLVESLKASEMSSITHGVRALEDTLEETAEVILVLINAFGELPLEVQRKDEIFEIMGKEFAFGESVPVSDLDFGVNVEISSGLAFTGEARQERAIELAKLGLIDTKTALEYLQIGGDVDEIATKALAELEQKANVKTKDDMELELKQLELQAEMQKEKEKLRLDELELLKEKNELELKRLESQFEMQKKSEELKLEQIKLQFEIEKEKEKLRLEQIELQADIDKEKEKLRLERFEKAENMVDTVDFQKLSPETQSLVIEELKRKLGQGQ